MKYRFGQLSVDRTRNTRHKESWLIFRFDESTRVELSKVVGFYFNQIHLSVSGTSIRIDGMELVQWLNMLDAIWKSIELIDELRALI